MPIDLFGSAKATAVVAIVAASAGSPVLMKADALDGVASKLRGGATHEAVPTEHVVAGGVQFAMPQSWGRLGATAAAGAARERVGTVVNALCPAGSAGSSCTGGVQLTFVAYSGKEGHTLPVLPTFEEQLDQRLGREFRGFRRGDVKMRPGADGIRYLDYPFTWRAGAAVHHQRFAAYRLEDGSGVVTISTGAPGEHAAAVDTFLASAHDPESAAG